MNDAVAAVFEAFLGRRPHPSEAAGPQEVEAALAAVVGGAEFRDRVVLPLAAGNALSTWLAAPVDAERLAVQLPLTAAARIEMAQVSSRAEMVRRAFRDRIFLEKVHAVCRPDWPAEILGAPTPPSPSSAATDPVVSILMPVYNTPPDILDEAIASVLRQTYPHWELCICDDASTLPMTEHLLEKYRGSDPRIKIVRSVNNLHISGATNLAAQFATGEFIGLLDHDDTLTADALQRMADAVAQHPDGDVFYSDEDKIETDGSFSEPYLKPDWSPEHLSSVAYLLHFMVLRKTLFLELGGFRDQYSGAQDYDLSLRATTRARRVVHVPHVLYHWRKIAGSAAAAVDAKPTALLNAAAAVKDFARGQDADATVAPGLFRGSFRVQWPVSPERPVTLLMLTDSRRQDVAGRGDILMVKNAADSILSRSTFRNYELVIVDNGRMPSDVRSELETRGARIENYAFEPPFSFPLKINAAFDHVRTEDVVILNDDIEVITPDWLEALLAHSRRPGVGVVGARLLYPDDRIQHAGMALGVHGVSTHLFHRQPVNEVGYCGFTHLVRNYSAVTGAVLATRMSLVRWLGGFDPQLRIDYNDVDFCLRAGALGLRNVYTPFATLYHFEGSTLRRPSVTEPDQARFVARWSSVVKQDPFYNPGLPKDRTDCQAVSW